MNSETFLFSLPNYQTLIYDENRRVSKFSTWDWIPTSRFSSKSAKFTNPNNCFNQFKSTEYTGKLMWELVYSLQGPMCVVAMQWRVFLAVNLSEISFILLSLSIIDTCCNVVVTIITLMHSLPFCRQRQLDCLKCCRRQCDQIGRFFCTLGNFLKPLATNSLPKSLKFLGNFGKDVKIYHFSCEIIFGQVLQTFRDFYLVTLAATNTNILRLVL